MSMPTPAAKASAESRATAPRATRRWARACAAACLLALLCAAALAAWLPLPSAARDELFEIPPGTWDARMAGVRQDILPRVVHLTLGVKDVLVVRNKDRVPQTVGPVLIMPGQQFRMPFDVPSENQFDCTAHSDGQLTVLVEPEPTPGLARLAWRARRALRWLNP